MPHRTALRADVVAKLLQRREGRPIGRLGVPHLFQLEKTGAEKCCLIVVDMQEKFFPGCPMNHEIVEPINRMVDGLRAMGGKVCWITSDVGPDALENWSVMYDNFFGEKEVEIKKKLEQGGLDFGDDYDPKRAAHGMDGPIWHELNVDRAADWIVKKDRHSSFAIGGYQQGLTASDEKLSAPAPPQLLESRLKAAGITTVVVAGCV